MMCDFLSEGPGDYANVRHGQGGVGCGSQYLAGLRRARLRRNAKGASPSQSGIATSSACSLIGVAPGFASSRRSQGKYPAFSTVIRCVPGGNATPCDATYASAPRYRSSIVTDASRTLPAIRSDTVAGPV